MSFPLVFPSTNGFGGFFAGSPTVRLLFRPRVLKPEGAFPISPGVSRFVIAEHYAAIDIRSPVDRIVSSCSGQDFHGSGLLSPLSPAYEFSGACRVADTLQRESRAE